MRGSGWGILHHLALGKLNSMGSWCTELSDYMGGLCPRKLNSMGGWVKKKCRLSPPGVFFWNSLYAYTGFNLEGPWGYWPPFLSDGPLLKIEWDSFNIM